MTAAANRAGQGRAKFGRWHFGLGRVGECWQRQQGQQYQQPRHMTTQLRQEELEEEMEELTCVSWEV